MRRKTEEVKEEQGKDHTKAHTKDKATKARARMKRHEEKGMVEKEQDRSSV